MFAGSGGYENVISQAQHINQSVFYKLELKWKKALKNGDKVQVNIKINYANDTSLRPDSFDVSYKIGDGKTITKNIKNVNPE